MSLPPPGAGRTALVTGASSGIGAEIARELARRGHQVVLVARSTERLAALADDLGPGARTLTADLADPQARAGLPGRVEELGLVTDILVNNAGYSTLGAVHHADAAAEVSMLEVDVVAVAELCTRFLPGMVERGRGAVLNVASTAAFQPLPGQAAYAAAKSFVLSYTQALAGELRGTGVTATALCPGPVATRFVETAGFSQEQAEHALPKLLWESAADVARAAVDGMERGRRVVIPGVANRVTSAFASVTPRSLLLPVVSRAHPGLRH
ncbi:MAG TPA: SDR family oxidoreductase [Jatrophihabitans sp.]|nr:SDR family oxidoreductase [Jatrophihabitans sp.]